MPAVVQRELKREMDKEQQDSEWGAPELSEEQIRYAAYDAHVLPELADKLMPRLAKARLLDVYALEVRVSHAVAAMERNGFAVNVAKLDPFVDEVTEHAETLKAELEAEWSINPGSSKQLREHFELDGREDWPKTPAGAPKTDQDSMAALEKHIVDGWIHARFNLIKADYASIKLWVAILWDDPRMQHALQQGVNMHFATGAALFNVKPGEITKEQNPLHASPPKHLYLR